MSLGSAAYRRLVIEWLAIVLLLAAFSAVATWRAWLTPLNDQLFDLAISVAQRPAPSDVVIIGIDDRSIAELGNWPWRRDLHAALVDTLTRGGARAVALDVLLTEASQNAGADLALADALRRSGKVVLPVFHEIRPDRSARELAPIVQFAQSAAALGHIDATIDADGVMRGYTRFAQDTATPHIALRILQVAERSGGVAHALATPPAAPRAGSAMPGEFRRIPFAGPSGSFPTLSYADVLKGYIPAQSFKDKIVLVGALATGMGDSYTVPAARGRGPMAGVEIIANILDGERGARSITRADPLQASIAGALLPLIVLLLMLRLPEKVALTVVGSAVLATLALALAMPQLAGTWWPPAAALIVLGLAYPLWSWRCLAAAQALIDKELACVSLHAALPVALPSRHSLIGRMDRMRALRAGLDEAQRQKEETLRFISHDLRAPLASLITLIESTASRYRDDPAHPWLGTMRNRAERALAMADDFLRLARAEAIHSRNFADCCLLAVIDEAIDEFWPQANAKGVTLARDFAVPDSEALMAGEEGLLRRAFANLLSNAIRHAPPDSSIGIGLRAGGDAWIATVSDAGPGVPEQNLQTLFGRSPRSLGHDPAGNDGTGLGLLIVRTVIERHGGTIQVSSPAGLGTTFTLRLPRATGTARI